MEVDSSFSSLLQNLKVDGPWVPPKTWESISSESGTFGLGEDAHRLRNSNADPSSISEAVLVRLVLNALLGVKSALVEVEKISVDFCSSPADRTSLSVPNLWCRASSSMALGKMLKSISYSGLLIFFLHNFVNYFLCVRPHLMCKSGDKGGKICHQNERNTRSPFSLINQAFSVAVQKVLEGYLCALDTLFASVKLRRSPNSVDTTEHVLDVPGTFTSIVHSEITVLEVYLHTKELRTLAEALGTICFPKVADIASSGDFIATNGYLEFHNFPRGTDLLTYLYVQLRDADPVHHKLLKFLFVRSCQPYCGFIKSWIYRASTDDPYEEFFQVFSDNSPDSNCKVESPNIFSASIEKFEFGEHYHIYVPCFLKEFCVPLRRAGQQLRVLASMLNMCNAVSAGSCIPCGLEDLDDIIPFGTSAPTDSVFVLNPITFSKKTIEIVIHKRENMYRKMLENLQVFFSELDFRFHLMNNNSLTSKRKGASLPFPMVSDLDLTLSPAPDELGTTSFVAGQTGTEASSTSEESSYDWEPLEAKECSTSNSSGEETDPPEVLSDTKWCTDKSILHNCPRTELLSSRNNNERIDTVSPASFLYYENMKLSHISPLQSGGTECVKMPKTLDEVFDSVECWPLGGLLKNPFDRKQQHFTDRGQQMTNGSAENFEGEVPYFMSNSELDTRNIKIMNNTNKTLSSCVRQPWDYHELYDLGMNPMLAKPAWLRTVRNSKDKCSSHNYGSYFPNFDFLSVTDPCKAYSTNIIDVPDCGSQIETTTPAAIGSKTETLLPVITNTFAVEESDCSDDFRDNLEPQSAPNSVCPSRQENPISGDVLRSGYGGANWEGLLRFSGKEAKPTAEESWCGSVGTFEIPLDIIIDKCIVQEILVQYKYISTFTIKFLEKGFYLREHLLAMRRYHFMDLADWADSFLISLCTHKWSNLEPEQKMTEIGRLLDLALQRSSCENDQYKERLFVYQRRDNKMPESSSLIGVHAFDFMMLGYRVDWPVRLIVTQNALEIYAEIFSYLIRVRLAVFSLCDAWQSLKDLMHSTYHSRHIGSNKMEDFSVLVKLRQQINHFVSTIQQYVHSRLSDVSWSRFQHSLKYEVKDMLDLEMLHMRYLADALKICFLSNETKGVAAIISSILQCAVDFKLCLAGVGSNAVDPSSLHSRINFSQVFLVKAAFEKNIKELYRLYLRSPKHEEFGIRNFWDHLDYNGYYSATIVKESGHLYP